jgi:cytochrome c oxidase assembly factor CtaG
VLIAALATENKIVLGGTAVVFIAFSLASAFVIPRRWPDYPGRRLGVFIVATVVLTLAMLSAVEFFAKEEEEPGGGHSEAVVLRIG